MTLTVPEVNPSLICQISDKEFPEIKAKIPYLEGDSSNAASKMPVCRLRPSPPTRSGLLPRPAYARKTFPATACSTYSATLMPVLRRFMITVKMRMCTRLLIKSRIKSSLGRPPHCLS